MLEVGTRIYNGGEESTHGGGGFGICERSGREIRVRSAQRLRGTAPHKTPPEKLAAAMVLPPIDTSDWR